MKSKILLTLFIFFGCVTHLMAQSLDDQSKILQKCIELPALQTHYPRTDNGTLKPLYVMQHAVSFPGNLNVTKNGKPVAFKSKEEVKTNGISAFFLFREFKVTQNSAQVDFAYYYNFQGTYEEFVPVTLELQKTGNTWSITQSKIQEK
ncbi:hypothetical protein [Adhaeribacter radiodurans]|uniref:Nuclear transport factor 2 family protein n=1 Tax=Adhaeribacter radiodurans TaxID=2745197 RepID=A0A7L7L8Y0_9BACT|nr:hypothetical protein [Adhaeribacter radiodurans]QMU29292.1 hypothetical protein HUW48_15170 [Adhaeribacter radiodurans]